MSWTVKWAYWSLHLPLNEMRYVYVEELGEVSNTVQMWSGRIEHLRGTLRKRPVQKEDRVTRQEGNGHQVFCRALEKYRSRSRKCTRTHFSKNIGEFTDSPGPLFGTPVIFVPQNYSLNFSKPGSP